MPESIALGMIATIGGIALAAAFARNRFLGMLDRTEVWRHRAGTVLEVGGSVVVLVMAQSEGMAAVAMLLAHFRALSEAANP